MAEKKAHPVSEYSASQLEPATPTQQDAAQAAHTTAQVAMALGALDNRYKENLAAYAEELHEASHRIELAKTELSQAHKQKKPYAEALANIQREIDHELRMLEHQTQRFIQDAKVIRELKKELVSLSHTDKMATRVQFRAEGLKDLENEIGTLELTLLNHELEKENLQIKIEPIDQKIRALEKQIADLEAHKRYIESAHLHRITQIQSMDKQTTPLLHETKKEDASV